MRRDEVSKNQADNLITLLDGYFNGEFGGQHINVNVIDKDMLLHAQQHPELYSTLTVRVSGYCVLFNSLTREQQDEVISRTFHDHI